MAYCIDTAMAGNSTLPDLPSQRLWQATSHQFADFALSSEEFAERNLLSIDATLDNRPEISGKDTLRPSNSFVRQDSCAIPSPTSTTIAEEGLTHHDISKGIGKKLYISHFISTWNSRGFEFGAILFLATIYPGTLLPMSIYALSRAASAVIFASAIGNYIDNVERLKVIRRSIVWQRGAVLVSCALFWVMLAKKGSIPTWSMILLLSANIALACIEKLGSIMNTVSVERDWVIVIAGGDESALRQMNSQMRRIDLLCKLISPLIIALLDGLSTEVAIVFTLVMNGTSMVLEYVLIARVYKAFPSLSDGRTPARAEMADTSQTLSLTQTVVQQIHSLVDNIRVYLSQDAFLASMSLSILYLTVLSFSGQMVTYLLAVSYTSTIVGLIRMLSTACEVSATWLAPWIMSKIGPVRTGIWFLSFQMISLGIAVLIFWFLEAPTWAAAGLVGGTVLSRTGLWGFDLSVQIIIQEEIEPQYRGAFSTTEAALQNLFELCAYISTIIFSRPSDFKYPATMSICAVYIAAALYAKFVRDRRGHLFHASKCMKPRSDSRIFYRQIQET